MNSLDSGDRTPLWNDPLTTDADRADRDAGDRWSEAFIDALRAQQRKIREFLAELRERERRAREEIEAWLTPSGVPAKAGDAVNQPLDWESEKRRVLAALEAESDESQAESPSNREHLIDIQELVCRTDRLLAEKDREIAELRQLLKDQSANLGSVAVGAAAIGELLDGDAVIQEEREQLRRLQSEWEDKLRTAEIEISVERAKLARQRAELEEMLRENQLPETAGAPATPKAGKKPPGRWLARLGLKDPKSD